MSVERDSDRQLRAWAAEGVDRAPERFVWAALDEIEGVPQRTAWRTRVDGLALRLRPAAVLVGAAAVILIAIAILARAVAPSLGIGGPRDFVTGDLPGIVLWDDTIPANWTLDNLVSNPWEVSVVPIRSMTGEEIDAREEPDGLVAGRYTNGLGQPDLAFISWSALFESESQAQAALPFYEHEMEAEEAWGLGPGEPIAFGDGGRLYTGTTTAFLGPPSDTNEATEAHVYLWRDGNLLLALGGYGLYDAAVLRALAEGMDARADAASKTTR